MNEQAKNVIQVTNESFSRQPEFQRRESNQQVATSEAQAFIQMLERAARDPSVDVAKIEKLMELNQRVVDRQSEVAYNVALSALQSELPVIPERGTIKNKSGGKQSTYALWEDLNEIIKPILSRHGFALTFRTGREGADMKVEGVLSHAAGHSERTTMYLPLDVSGSKNNVQGVGSSVSYGKRYTASALLNLTSRGEDNDGQGGRGLDESQKADFLAAIEACASIEECETLWPKIAGETTKCGDVPAHEELKAAMIARRKALKVKA